MKKRILSLVLVMALALTLLPMTAFANETDKNIAESCTLFLDGDPGWRVYPVNSIDTALTAEQLNLVLKTNDGEIVDPSRYTLSIKKQVDWDDEHDCPITADADEPYGITGEENRQAGFMSYYAFVEAKEGSGFTGDFTNEFIIWDEHSINWFGATTDFGEHYKSNSTWFWHDYYRIPVGEIREPEVSDITHRLIDPSEYTITYFRRNTDLPDFDDPAYQEKVFPEDNPLEAMPEEEGAYFARVKAKETSSYYGTSYVDFDIVTPKSYAGVKNSPERFYEGDTVSIRDDESLYVYFDLDPRPDGLIVGWDADSFREAGFTVEAADFLEEDGIVYANVSANGLSAGTKGTLIYSWYRIEDIFGENAVGWSNAEPVSESSVGFEVEGQPEGFIFGDSDNDRVVSVLDATTIQKKLASLPVTDFNPPAADANRNGFTDVLDATFIQKHLAHIEIPYDLGEEGYYGTYYAAWNVNENILPEGIKLSEEQAAQAQANIRKALCILFDRSSLLAQVKLEKKPASSFVSNWITDADGREFYLNAGDDDSFYGYFDVSKDYDTAAINFLRKYYSYDEKTGKFTDFPTLTYLYNEGEVHRAIGTFLQTRFLELGITVELREAGWDEYSDKIAEGGFSFCRSGWIVDYDDPMEFLRMWRSDSEDNLIGLGTSDHADLHVYSLDLRPYHLDYFIENGTWEETYDRLIDMIDRLRNRDTRYKLMHLAEDMLMDTGCITPLYYY